MDANLPYTGASHKIVLDDAESRNNPSSVVVHLPMAFVKISSLTLGRGNPSKGRFTVHLESALSEQISLELVNLQGAILHQAKVDFVAPQTDVVIDISTLPKGVYILRLKSDNLLRFERIVIQ